MKRIIKMQKLTGDFAENKDIAKKLRIEKIMSFLLKSDEIIIDFKEVDGVTQSFIHALISDPIREFKETAFDKLYYRNANKDVQEIISIVYRYMQESLNNNSE